MKRTLCIFLFIILFCMIEIGSIQAQVGITAVPFLQLNNHARSMGMAGATVALRHHDAGLHLNPAVIGNPGHIEIGRSAKVR